MLSTEYLPESRPRGNARRGKRGPASDSEKFAEALFQFETDLARLAEFYLDIADRQREKEMKAERRIQGLSDAQARRDGFIADTTSTINVALVIVQHMARGSKGYDALAVFIEINHCAIAAAGAANRRDEEAISRQIQAADEARRRMDAAVEVVLAGRIKKRKMYDGW
uniref:Uncharacterized protein n=1 Tax=Mycena chlorophos TaxID=658473 RepID=A0ABQ0L2N0_MYCCL|nr:predicted protein [Mycena chlorophos]